MMNEHKIHIAPGDYIADIDEFADGSEPRSRCRYYIEPYGPYQINEVGEANYFAGNSVPYHEHTSGVETFLVDGGAVEVMSRSRKAVARKGDIVHLPPHTPHSIRVLEDDTIWRAFHQGHSLIPRMIDERRLRDNYPDIFNSPQFKQEQREKERRNSNWYDYKTPVCAEVPVSEFPEIRSRDKSLARFSFDKLVLELVVGRWETCGANEVWRLVMGRGCSFAWAPSNAAPLLYDVFDGELLVSLDGMAPFTTKTRDLLHIPKFLGGRITAKEDTLLLDMSCQGRLMSYMDEFNYYRANMPEKLSDEAFLSELMKKHDCYANFGAASVQSGKS